MDVFDGMNTADLIERLASEKELREELIEVLKDE